MISISILFILLSNAVTSRRDISIIFNRIAILVLIYCVLQELTSISLITNGMSLHGNLLHKTNVTQIFSIFIFIISIFILHLTSFYPKKLVISEFTQKSSYLYKDYLLHFNSIINKIFNNIKLNEHLKIIEYPLILLFIIMGAIFLISANDLISIFLAIELQSYGLYLLSAINKDSELSTAGGLIYFLLGGLSSCFILLGTSLLYANSGVTNLDSLYILINIMDASDLGF
jgi:NADH-ubiquinone oxidoreductase chain 2